MVRRLFVERRPSFQEEAKALLADLQHHLELPHLSDLAIFLRFDVEGIDDRTWELACSQLFADPTTEILHFEDFPHSKEDHVVGLEYLPGQFNQRAESAAQCIQLMSLHKPLVATATIYRLRGNLGDQDLARIRKYLINPVDSREASLDLPTTLTHDLPEPSPVPVLSGFLHMSAPALAELRQRRGLAMSNADLAFLQQHFRDVEQRDPTETEITVLDTYWSDHCRHTTFHTRLESIDIEPHRLTQTCAATLRRFIDRSSIRHPDAAAPRPVSLMEIALAAMREMRNRGELEDLEVSEEVNAASIIVEAKVDGQLESWLLMFKNETHNHPTEIEPFGGAATCLGGAIRDPLSGRSYVYQAMRVSGSADPRKPVSETLPGKLPQRKITVEAAHGYSSYGNQIGLATGLVHEVYHPRYEAKRMEIGAVIGAAPRRHVRRENPAPGDIVILVGGRTGRDGIGGATGSSKEHRDDALEQSAEVQKGDPPTERKLQRLFRRQKAARMIKRCNDFGAGGVSVAIGELAPGLRINLDAVPLKYQGLGGTELAVSESQERMAVVIAPEDREAFEEHVRQENLECAVVAVVTEQPRMVMTWRGQDIVNISRAFLDSAGVRNSARAYIVAPDADSTPLAAGAADASLELGERWKHWLSQLSFCSQKGLQERFDGSIGTGTVLHPLGGRHQLTPVEAMCAKLPVQPWEQTDSASLMSFGFDPYLSEWSPFHGAVFAIVQAVARIVAAGGRRDRIRLSLQEYYERLRDDPRRWGKPAAALLGAYFAQTELGIPAVGGKDSMSGSFNDLDVPPTLVAFAVDFIDSGEAISPEFKMAGNAIGLLQVPLTPELLPDFRVLKTHYDDISDWRKQGRIASLRSIGRGGLAEALAVMAFGNGLGVAIGAAPEVPDLFQPLPGSILIEWNGDAPGDAAQLIAVGQVRSEPSIRTSTGQTIELGELQQAWSAPLESIFPVSAPKTADPVARSERPPNTKPAPRQPIFPVQRPELNGARPRVVIPAFPGTNCEIDSDRAFHEAGAETQVIVFRNLDSTAISESIEVLAAAIDRSHILLLPGGFSAGDEPAGSGKFIAAVLRNPRISDAVHRLLDERDGLILGICNGFQAMIKTGLLPHGRITEPSEADPTLTFNTLNRHVACVANTRVLPSHSPWLSQCDPDHIYRVPVSHGEGRFVASPEMLEKLWAGHQVATQYVDHEGNPSQAITYNPNGSTDAIEGILSPDGRVFGKMGHSERVGPDLLRNIPGLRPQPIFAGGVAYFS